MSMNRCRILSALAAAALLSGAVSPLMAAITNFDGTDSGAGPADPRPNSNAAAASFDAAAGALGPIGLINFENVPLGNFAALPIAPGVTATLTGTATEGGIRTTPSLFNGEFPNLLGYNTTVGGERFLSVVPIFDIGTARLTLNFAQPIQAFGSYLTGFEGFNSNLFVMFNDGSNQTIPLSGSINGGARFFGFTDPGAEIVQVAMELRNVIGGSRDIFSLDDIHYVGVPEPASFIHAFLPAAAGLAARRRRSGHRS